MKKFIGVLFALLVTAGLQAQDLDGILKKHFEAEGLQKRLKVQTIKLSGKFMQGGQEFPYDLYMGRPLKIRNEISVQGQKLISAYDGENGWMINPMMGTMEPQDLPPEAIKEMEEMADIDGELYKYKEKGHSLEYIGEEDVDGTAAYHLKLTKKSGDIDNYFLDKDSYVIIKVKSKRIVNDVEVESEQLTGNYEIIEGIAFPMSITAMFNGQVATEIVIESVELDVELKDDFFTKPAGQ